MIGDNRRSQWPPWPDLIHGCRVQRSRLHTKPLEQSTIPVAVLVTAIHDFLRVGYDGFEGVDARNTSGQGVSQIVPS